MCLYLSGLVWNFLLQFTVHSLLQSLKLKIALQKKTTVLSVRVQLERVKFGDEKLISLPELNNIRYQ